MQRIMVIGCCGSGKSTLSKRLHDLLGLELIHLDQHYWKPNWTEPSQADWKSTVQHLLTKDSWIIDGNYGGTMQMRMDKADTIVFLNYPTIRCLARVVKRVFKYHGKVRPDMPEGCKERFDLDFLHYVATFNIRKGKKLMNQLNAVGADVKVYDLKNDEEVAAFVGGLVCK